MINLLNWAEAEKIRFWGDPEDIKQMIDKGNFLMAAQELQDRLGSAKIGEFLDFVFGDKSVRPSNAHLLLPHIPFRAILTTNYDSLIEGGYALKSDGKIPPVFTQEDLLDRPSPLRRNDFFIFKLHGHIDRPSTIILGSRDYQEILFRTPGYRHFIETLFSTHTIVFVGFGAEDPDLDIILDKLSSIYSRTLDKHYILLPSERMNPTEKRRLAFDRRLEVIDYKKDKGHTQVTEFFRELIVQVERKEIEITPFHDIEEDRLNIYLSGSYKDIDLLNRIAKFLKENGYSPWLPETKPYQLYGQKSANALNQADCMILILSKKSAPSMWIRNMVEHAIFRELENKMNVIPIVIGIAWTPSYLANRQLIKLDEAFDFDDKELKLLLNELSRLENKKQELKK